MKRQEEGRRRQQNGGNGHGRGQGRGQGRGRGSSATRTSPQVTAVPSLSSERDGGGGVGFSIDNVLRLLSDSDPAVAKTAFQHTLDTVPIIRNLDENVAIRFWFAYYYFGLYENLGLTVDDTLESFSLFDLKGHGSLIDRKLASIKKILQVWPNKFWAQLARWGVRLPREPSGGTLSKLYQVASREGLSVDIFAVQFLAWLPEDLISRKGGMQQLELWKAGKRDVTEVDLSRFLESKGDEAAKERKDKATTEELAQEKDGATQTRPRKRRATSDLTAAKRRAKEKTPSSASPSLDSVQGLNDELDERDQFMGLSLPLPEPENTNDSLLCLSKTGNIQPSPLVVIRARSTSPHEDGTTGNQTDMDTSTANISTSTLSVAQRSTGIKVPRTLTSASQTIPAPQFTAINALRSKTTTVLLHNATSASLSDGMSASANAPNSLPQSSISRPGSSHLGQTGIFGATPAQPAHMAPVPHRISSFMAVTMSDLDLDHDYAIRSSSPALIGSTHVNPVFNITVHTPTGPSLLRPELLTSETAPTCPSKIPSVSGRSQPSSSSAGTNLSPKHSNSVPSHIRPLPEPSEIIPLPDKPTPAPSTPEGLLGNSMQTCSALLSQLSICKTCTLSARTRYTAAQKTFIETTSACNIAFTTNFELRTGTTLERMQSFLKDLSDQLAAKARIRGVFERTLADVEDDPSAASEVQALIDAKIREIEGLTKQKEEGKDALANFGRAEIELEEAKKELDVAATAEKELLTEIEEKVERIKQSTAKRKKVAETLTANANKLLDKAKEIEGDVKAKQEFLAKAKQAIEQDMT